jgi:hypothetical protein
MDTSFKRIYKSSLKDFNLEEARGWIIDRLNQIEYVIDDLITKHFQPSNTNDFQRIILNTSIISIGGKLKILRSIKAVDNKTIDGISKLSSIRNAFAHAPVITNITIEVDETEGGGSEISSICDNIEVMTSSGEIKTKNAREYLEEFWELNKEIRKSLAAFQR